MPFADSQREDEASMSRIHQTHFGGLGRNTKPPALNLLLPTHEPTIFDDFKTNASAGWEKMTLEGRNGRQKTHHSTGSLSPTSTAAIRNRASVKPLWNGNTDPISFSLDTSAASSRTPHSHLDSRQRALRGWLPTSNRYLSRSRSIFASPPAYLAYYFVLNLSLTLQNKHILLGFPFPYTLSAIHAFCSSVGCHILVRTGSTPAPRLDRQEWIVLLSFSCLYTVNIIISNLSLGLVTVPFHQVVRASVPFFIIVFSYIILGSSASKNRCISLIPVVAGVALATYGDYYFTPMGFLLTLLGTALAALKTIFTNILQRPPSRSRSMSDATPTKSPISSLLPQGMHTFKLPPFTPLQLLYYLSPLAFAQTLAIAYLSGEYGRVGSSLASVFRGLESGHPPGPVLTSAILIALVVNGCIAFVLNIASFNANKKVGALGMAVAGNVKQVLTILCAVGLFNLTITPMNGLGIAFTLLGGAWYGYIELKEKQAQDKHLRFV